MISQYPRLADPSDIPRLLEDDRVTWSWPPPGTTVTRLGFPETWVLVSGVPSEGAPGDWWVTSLETIAGYLDQDVASVLTQLSKVFTGPIATFAGTVGNWPVIYETPGAKTMRWIQTTFRGTLGAVEQFQFQINWGTPGDDPDLSEAGLLSFAESVRDIWKTEWKTGGGGTPMQTRHTADVAFTEVGAATLVITDATNADGSGGNLSQPHPTQWAPYLVGDAMAGTATGGTTVSLPFEVACALTLQTDTRGPRGRGRCYLPPFATNVMAAGGVFANAIVTGVGASVGVFFDAVTVANPGIIPVVVSKRAVQLHPVTSILVGRVPDSQRRRRRSQDELRALAWSA